MDGLNLLTYNNLSLCGDSIVHFSSTRGGGVSCGAYGSLNLGTFTNDGKENVESNKRLLCRALGIPLQNLHNAHQTHGKRVRVIDSEYLNLPLEKRRVELEGFDALVTDVPGQCVTVTTADCVPVLLYDGEHRVVAAIHSGWRGTLENICKDTVCLMQSRFGSHPGRLVAAIGPCISQPKYEVGADLYDKFAARGFDADSLFIQTTQEKYLFDIRKAVRMQLQVLGVTDVEVSPYCTYTDSDLFFSARRMGNDSGRMLSGIYLRSI